ncbi:MAG: TatD family hydrolase [Clostridia bacterium]|nr:TatD family hydrolase [Clostridia bacterium]
MTYENIFDTHAHYDDDSFDEDRFSLLDEMFENGVSGIINCGCTVESSKKSIEFAEKYSKIYSAVGIHPQNAAEEKADALEQIEKLASHEKVVAIGEIGLDYHYDYTPKEMQLEWFEKQILLAKKLDLPVIVHDREAHADCLELILKHRPRGVMHCFSGSVETAKQLTDIGFYIGLGGSVTFKNARKPQEVAASVDISKLLLETDCPYMTPVPFRGRRNNSALIAHTAEKIAELRNITAQEIINTATLNAKQLFNIK